jgi:hypothetical protein
MPAVAVASAVVGRWKLPDVAGSPAVAAVGAGIGAAVLLLRDAAMPAGYASALWEQVRQEYLMPRRSGGTAPVAGHQFALVEGEVPRSVGFAADGLVSVVPGGAVIRTGTAEGSEHVLLTVSEQPPPLEVRGWDEVVEVSWRAAAGLASVTGLGAAGPGQLGWATPPWPGDYRLRVHASGRDDADDEESYELAVWPAPGTPAVVHKHTDQLGWVTSSRPSSRPTASTRVRRSRPPWTAWTSTTTGTPPVRAWSQSSVSPATASPPRTWNASRQPTSPSGSHPTTLLTRRLGTWRISR